MSRSLRLLPFELAAIVALFWADARGLVPLSKTPFLLVLALASLRLRGRAWADVGLRRPPSWSRALALGLVAGIAIEALELFATTPLLARFTGEVADVSAFAAITGNVAALAIGLALIWVLAAFGEELVWRGYLLDRLTGLVQRPALALVIVSVAFGLAHAPQGIAGVVENTLDGVWLGLVYYASGKNLVAAIVAHGITDTIDLALIFSGRYPGT